MIMAFLVGIVQRNFTRWDHSVFCLLVQILWIYENRLTHWGWVTHICVAYLTIIVSDNGLSPSRRQAIILTNSGLLLIRPLGANFSEILIEIDKFSFMKMDLKVSSAKWRPFCVGLNALRWYWITIVLYVYRRPGRDVSRGVILWNNVFLPFWLFLVLIKIFLFAFKCFMCNPE